MKLRGERKLNSVRWLAREFVGKLPGLRLDSLRGPVVDLVSPLRGTARPRSVDRGALVQALSRCTGATRRVVPEGGGGLALTSGILLLLAVPLTYLLIRGFLGPVPPSFLGPYLVCSLAVHFFLAFGAFWGAYRGLKFLLAGGSMLLILGVAALFASVFLLGTLLGLLAGVLLIVAAILVYSS